MIIETAFDGVKIFAHPIGELRGFTYEQGWGGSVIFESVDNEVPTIFDITWEKDGIQHLVNDLELTYAGEPFTHKVSRDKVYTYRRKK